jgi:hypothetical protein
MEQVIPFLANIGHDMVIIGGVIFKHVVDNAPYLVGFFMPPLVDVLNRDIKDETERFIVSTLLCAIAAFIIQYPSLRLGSVEGFAGTIALLFTESQTIFKLYFKQSALRGQLLTKIYPDMTKKEIKAETTEAKS